MSERKPTYEELEVQLSRAKEALSLQSAITTNMAEGVCLIRAHDGTIVYANPTFEKMFGYAPGEIIGKHVSVINAPTEKSPEEKVKEIDKIDVWRGEVYNVNKEGTPFWCYASISMFEHPVYGKVQVAVHIDITERKRAAEALKTERAQLLSLFDSIDEIIYVTDMDTHEILYSNKAVQKAFQKPLIGEKCYKEFQGLALPCEFCTNPIIKTLNYQPYHWEYHNPLLNADFRITDRVIKWPDGRDVRFEMAIDITERKKAEMIQKILYQIASAVHTSKSISELSEVIQQELGTIIDTKNFFIALYNKENNTISLPYYKDEKDHFETFPAGKTCTAYIIHNDKSLLANNKKIDELVQSGEIKIIGTIAKVWLGVPLKLGEEVTGAIVAQSYTDENAYNEKDLEILEFVASQIGLFIERKQAEEDLKKRLEELEIFYNATIGREGHIIELKQQINELLAQLGKEKKYEI